jgi:hypothetical protein
VIWKKVNMNPLSSALAVLSAMITPAILISACGTLVLSTSTRLGRVVDRVREILADNFEPPSGDVLSKQQVEKRSIILDQLDLFTNRASLLQRSLTSLYLAIGFFVLTTVDIGIAATAGAHKLSLVAIILGLIGSSSLCYSSMLLILEARLAFVTTKREMDFLRRLGHRYASHASNEEERPR